MRCTRSSSRVCVIIHNIVFYERSIQWVEVYCRKNKLFSTDNVYPCKVKLCIWGSAPSPVKTSTSNTALHQLQINASATAGKGWVSPHLTSLFMYSLCPLPWLPKNTLFGLRPKECIYGLAMILYMSTSPYKPGQMNSAALENTVRVGIY